jgi:DUF4097 and DUF4098 domain-containing protein YvlB
MNRIWTLTTAACLALAAPLAAQDRATAAADAQQPPPIQARPGGPEGSPKTDQTLDVAKGTRLVLNNNAGEVVVRTWDRDQVRVQATHSDREKVDVQTAEMTLRIRARAARGASSLVDYQITVPRWMPVNLSGTYLETTIEGTAAEVTVETVHGNVKVVGGSGNVSVRSVEGTISVEKAAGRVQATTVNEGIRLIDVSGDMSAETTNGDIVVENAQTSSLEVSTVNGDVTFNGTVREKGSYRLTTHGGDIRVGLGGASNATVFVRTFQGNFNADFPIQLPEGQTARSGSKRFNFTLGNGSARIEVQSFNGDIVLAKGRVISAEELRQQRRRGEPVKNKDFASSFKHDLNLDHDFDFDFDFDHDVDPDYDVDFDFDFDTVLDFDFDPVPHPMPVVVPMSHAMPRAMPVPVPVPMPMGNPTPPRIR